MYTRFTDSRGVVLRKMNGRLDAAFQLGGGFGPSASVNAGAPALSFSLGAIAGLCLLALAVILLALFAGHGAISGLALATAPVATGKSLKQILTELKKIQDDHKGKAMPEDVGKQFQELAAEAKAMQDEADREAEIKRIEKFAAEVPNPALPAGAKAAEDREAKADASQVAGYISIGELFTSSDVFQAYVKSGAPAGISTAPVEAKGLQGRYVPLSPEQRKAVSEALGRMESKAVPTIGSGIVEPQRIADVTRTTEQDELRLRDLLNVSPTSSNAVEWVRITSYTRAAAMVAESAAKPEATMAADLVTTPVRTIAVWMPVTEQQLMDAPQITNMINSELLYDLDKVEEEEILYGSGSGQHFMGITNDTGVLAGRTVTGDTNLDKIRRSVTDIRRAGYAPNGVAIDPLDWEDIVLLKGTDDRYIYGVGTDDRGPRVWGLRVVETVGAEENAGNTTEERNIVVGDWVRGATLWDRMQAQVMVGWVNDNFIKNLRTIRAEKRSAFAVRRPKAFRKITTVAAVA